MTNNEQIQEMAKVLEFACEDMDCTRPSNCDLCQAKQLYAKGYRKVERGEWIVDGLANPKCSRCRSYNPTKAKYCPECGADMRGEKDESISTNT